ncbi:MAG: NADH-quinone oxidoreductase subunit F [Proteobacteria bacterium]|jgi:formate dehydrogenase|nr:NADH-quinone oxidoreductase subunit F [Pseudomonadota bacterium]MBT4107746.1 NADH-quinone oxidoreductase subunit F [Pseudomonadota bacterium]MBT5189873.1 NADH-quinone oxidoreductase subunit F [Pseudomonadota bacterium]MBT6065356.1 NADH-quinone oxidoreductase subunit F [Pseudomonadota bacterium]MBT6071105.1 NADH-quinone oxidoreductase subunit F [Pseudomonadota bacterium]
MKKSGGKRARPRAAGKGHAIDPEARSEVSALIKGLDLTRDNLIECLHCIQDAHKHLSDRHLVALADILKLAPTEVFEVATFYHHFDVVRHNEVPPPSLTVRVCDSVSCSMTGAEELIEDLESRLGADVRVQRVPCVGRCEQAPVAVVGQRPIGNADIDVVLSAVEQGNIGPATPTTWIRFDEYRAAGGYQTAGRVYDDSTFAEGIVDALDSSGLRGLGGAGFPAGRKWRILQGQPSPRLMAVNIDEGEPGTFKDRYYLERDPHRFLEGVLIAAQVVGIDRCYLYIRDEYPGVIEILHMAIAELRSDWDYTLPEIIIRRGAGAYICGEESAMIESIEGKRGLPRLRPPYVAEVGLFGRPTLEHNCETLYWVRDIIEKGADWFASQGRRGRKGLRSFSVSGRVKKPGVHLAPAGISLRELIAEYCGGMTEGHELYGYFPGGASGGVLPESLADEPLDFDTLQAHGCFIGSAAIVVISNHDSVRELARNTMKFFAHESCGQCTPCRVGCDRAVKLMEDKNWNQDLLEDLATVMEDASICGLGQAAPNPIRCTIKYFPHEIISE